jgi:hypothetical protein
MGEGIALHLPPLGPLGGWEEHPRALLLRSHAIASGASTIVDDPRDADVILFASVASGGLWMSRLMEHPLTRAYASKVQVYSEADSPWPWLPGIYTSIPSALFDQRVHRSGPYLPFHHTFGLGDAMRSIGPEPSPAFLYSFVGAAESAPQVRREVLRLRDERALLSDTSAERWAPFYGDAAARRPVFKRFLSAVAQSAFVLCPRGSGVGSIRIFEAMAAGRAPVIISDRWVAPDGPRWHEFSLRVAERDVESIPSILRANEVLAPSMGAAARIAWECWFAPEVLWRTVAGWCRELHATRDERRRADGIRDLLRPTQLLLIAREARSPIRPRPTSRLPTDTSPRRRRAR